MSNTLTGLIPTLYSSLAMVSRELIGFIPNVSVDGQASAAAMNQIVRSPVVPQRGLEDITPGVDPADSGDESVSYVDVTMTKSKAYPIRWTGEEQKQVTANGVVNTILARQFAQGFRTIANAVEADLGGLYAQMSRAYGTAGTTPFATADDMTDMAEANRILDENGAPASDRVMILGSAARAKLEGKQSHLFKANEAGTDGLLRSREMRQLSGFTMGYSAGVQTHTKGTGTGYDINEAAGEPVGETTLVVDGGTAGATGIVAGDVITAAGDSNKYLVTTGQAGAAGNLIIGKPGLKLAAANDTALTIGDSYTGNMFFNRSALLLAARAPAMPDGGDSAQDVMSLTDPVSGLTFQVALYRQYRQVKYEIGLTWGVAAPNPNWGGVLLG